MVLQVEPAAPDLAHRIGHDDIADAKVAALALGASVAAHRAGCGFYVAIGLAYFANVRAAIPRAMQRRAGSPPRLQPPPPPTAASSRPL